jgi:hypothetical protein
MADLFSWIHVRRPGKQFVEADEYVRHPPRSDGHGAFPGNILINELLPLEDGRNLNIFFGCFSDLDQ